MFEIKDYLIPKENIKYISIYKDPNYIIVWLNDGTTLKAEDTTSNDIKYKSFLSLSKKENK